MRASSTFGLIAGVCAEQPLPDLPELIAVGEETAPRRRQMPWHQHECWELYVQISGIATRASRQITCELAPGEAFLAPPATSHRVVNRGSAAQHSAYVRFDLAAIAGRHPGLLERWPVGGCLHLRHAGALIAGAERLVREVATEQAFQGAGARVALDALIIATARLAAGVPARILSPLPPAVERARSLLEDRCGEPWSVARLAEAVALSASHLRAQFTRYCGMPPHRYLLERRMDRARHLLAYTDLSVAGIAMQLGFATSQHFAARFRAHARMSARSFRQHLLQHTVTSAAKPFG